MLTLKNFDVAKKSVAIRVDLNSPLKNGKISVNERIRRHAETIKILLEKGCRVVVLAHQGRKGKDDFLPLEQHAKILNSLGVNVTYVNEVVGERAREAIEKLEDGEAVLLENVRMLDDETEKKSPEEHANSTLVKFLSPLIDVFMLDAFSVAHRGHASVVGFSSVVPSLAGPVLEEEVEKARRFRESVELPYVQVFGGAKIDDYIELLEKSVKDERVKKIIATGMLSQVILFARGVELGKSSEVIKEKFGNVVNKISKMATNEKITLPVDFAVKRNGERSEIDIHELPVDEEILDIGSKSVERFSALMAHAKSIFIKGPAGKYEEQGFEYGTKSLIKSAAESGALCLLCGGNTIDAGRDFLDRENVEYSLAGGAMIKYLSGHELPGLKALELSERKFFP